MRTVNKTDLAPDMVSEAARASMTRCVLPSVIAIETSKIVLHGLDPTRPDSRRPWGAARLSPWQSARGADRRGAQPHRAERARGVYLRRRGALGRRQFGSAVPPFPRPRRAARRCRAARFRGVRDASRKGVEWRQPGAVSRLR